MKRLGCLAVLAAAFAAFFAGSLRAQDAYNSAAEEKFLALMNEIRVGAGLPALKSDPHLKDAARLHVYEFTKRKNISDQYEGELGLRERVWAAQVPSGAVGEVMLRAPDLDHAADQLIDASMKPTVVNPRFSAAGVAAMQSGDQLFVVANLAQPLQMLEPDEVEGVVVDAFQQLRTAKKNAPFLVVSRPILRTYACEMAQKDSLNITPIDPYSGSNAPAADKSGQYKYTSVDPGTLPSELQKIGFEPKINTISVGACFAKSPTYPDGVYWIYVVLYGSHRFVRPE
jgi:hypothetical protein